MKKRERDARSKTWERKGVFWTEPPKVIQDIINERCRQDEKWGAKQNHDPFAWIAVLGEEYGEACQEALRLRFGENVVYERMLREELVQVAAVAVVAIECLDRGEWRWGVDGRTTRHPIVEEEPDDIP